VIAGEELEGHDHDVSKPSAAAALPSANIAEMRRFEDVQLDRQASV